MKIKTFNKKLALNKQTVTNLNSPEMNEVKGGAPTDRCIPTGIAACPTIDYSWCCQYSVDVSC